MKNKTLTLLLTLPILASCGGASSSSTPSAPSSQSSGASSESSHASGLTSDPSSPSQPSSSSSSQPGGDKYLFYDIKQGQTKEGLDGSPWLNSSCPGIASKVEKPSLKDDFYLAVNYDYLSSATLKEGQMGAGGVMDALNILQERFEHLGSNAQAKGDFSKTVQKAYSLYGASDKSKDKAAVKKLIDEIKAISSKEALFSFISSKRGSSFPWAYFDFIRTENGAALSDPRVGWTMATSLEAWQMGGEAEQEAAIEKLATILQFFGFSSDEAKSTVRKGFAEEMEMRKPTPGYSPESEGYKVSELNATFPNLKLSELFKEYGYADSAVIILDSDVYNIYKSINDVADNEGVEKIKADLLSRVCVGANFVLPPEVYIPLAQQFDPNSGGYDQPMFIRERFIEAIRKVYDRDYLDNFETRERKASLIQLMNDVKEEYHGVINKSSWLSQTTRAKAIEKLDAISFDACYPDNLLTLPAFTIEENTDNFYDVRSAYRQWSFLSAQPADVRPDLWLGSITTINGVYYPERNSFVLYDGILSYNNFSADNIEGIYASIGTVIGHEISHSFDNNGAQYNKYGMPEDWWTSEDKTAFTAKGQKIIDKWNSYSYKSGVKMWSEKMLGEIIADMGGVTVMLDLAAKKNGFDYDKFFKYYAQNSLSLFSPEFVEMMFYQRQDNHPMNYIRVNACLNQFAKFQEVYGIKEGDAMYVAEADRLPIW